MFLLKNLCFCLKSSCFLAGDSGGPLMVYSDRYNQVRLYKLLYSRRINTEEKANVVAAGGTWMLHFKDDLCKSFLREHPCWWVGVNQMIIHFSKHPFNQVAIFLFILSSWCIIASAARNWINSVIQTAATTFAFLLLGPLVTYAIYIWNDQSWSGHNYWTSPKSNNATICPLVKIEFQDNTLDT